jgi:hypothetical protein
MAAAKKDPKLGQVVLENVRASYLHIWKAQASVKDGKLKFSANFLIDPETADGKKNIKKCNAAVNAVAKEEWGDKFEKILAAIATDRMNFRAGETFTNDEGDIYAGYEDQMVAKGANERKFPIVDRAKQPTTESDGVIYSGCYVDAVLRFYTVSGKDKGGNGVFASLEAIRFRRDGEAFGAAPVDVDDVFDDLPDDEEVEEGELV